MPVQGVGSLLALDLLTFVSLQLIEPVISVTGPTITAGAHTIAVWDPSLYVGAQLVVGTIGIDLEAVVVTAISYGVSFTATFGVAHAAGFPIRGVTFPVQNSAGDPFFTQAEMLDYLSIAMNDFLTRVPLLYAVTETISFPPTEPVQPLPADCMVPVRVAVAGKSLRETSQANLDNYDYRWNTAGVGMPYTYYRDKVALQSFGIWPSAGNTTPVEVIYAQRAAQSFGMADGLPIPDCFLVYIKARMLAIAYSKDGEQKSPSMAKYFGARFETGVKISSVFLGVMMDPNVQQ